jgi:hypothetical protein
MERMLVSHKKYRLQVFFLLLCFVSFFISSQSAWGQTTTLNLDATWTAPTTNSDGTPLKDLVSFNLYRTDVTPRVQINTSPIPKTSGTTVSPYPFSVSVSGVGTLSFYATAVDSDGNESAPSATASFSYNVTPITCTVASNPSPGPQVTVDGISYSTPYTPTTWTVGTQHTLVATSPQSPTSGVRYIFTKWDNGSTSPSRQITVPSTTTTYTATFTTQYSLTTSVSPSNAGTVTPAGTTWYNSGKSASVTAKPNFGSTFTNWSGTVPGSSSSLSLTMTAPMTEVANFTQIPEELTTPTTPKNVTNGYTGASYSFSTKSTSNLRNPVQYKYSWGDGTTSDWGPATQSHFWVIQNIYNVTVTAKSATGVMSGASLAASVNIQQKPFIHVTSPNGGETWVGGAMHPITWNSNYLDPSGTIYLYYWFAGAWCPIASQPANSSTSFSYNWTVPAMPPTPPGPDSLVPKSHMSWTSVYIGNWVGGVNGTWQCWDTNDKAFKILENGWVFTISGPDKGGTTLYFNTDGTFDGYGISLNKGMFKIQGTYTVGANGLITGPYQLSDQLSDYSDNPAPSGTGNITGTPNLNATTMTMTLKDLNNAPVFTMSGVWLSELTMPEDWSVQISGTVKGTISPNNPLTIEPYEDSNNEAYANVFNVSGSGYLSDGNTPISIDLIFFFTPLKTVYGFYQLTIAGNSETGTLSGTLNSSTGKFTFTLTSSNGHKYTFAGIKVATE